MHAGRSHDLTYALAAEWRAGNGKTEAANQVFRSDIYKPQALRYRSRYLERLAAALRRTKGKLAASYLAASNACGRIWIFARRRDGKQQFRVGTDAMKLRKIFRREATHR
jgi:hypothetical protein